MAEGCLALAACWADVHSMAQQAVVVVVVVSVDSSGQVKRVIEISNSRQVDESGTVEQFAAGAALA